MLNVEHRLLVTGSCFECVHLLSSAEIKAVGSAPWQGTSGSVHSVH